MRVLLGTVVLIILISLSSCMEIYMKRSEIDDQASSASSYSYQTHSGDDDPSSYSTYNTDATGDNNNYDQFGYPPITVGRYTHQELVPFQVPPPLPNYIQSTQPTFSSYYGFPAGPYAYAFPQLGKPLEGIELETADYGHHIPYLYGPEIPRYGMGGLTSDYDYIKGGGKDYEEAKQASRGEKGEAAYQKQDEYDKGAKGSHENEAHKGYYNKEGANKAGHHEVGEHYDKKEAAAKSANGESFQQSSGHRKGSKTTGYHKVHHKDEYKKDHSFYDESDNSGQFKKYGDYDAKQANGAGKFAEGGHLVAGHHSGAYANKGFLDKGKFDEQDSGYKGEQGKEAHYSNFDEYAKKGEQQNGGQQGYKGIGQKLLF